MLLLVVCWASGLALRIGLRVTIAKGTGRRHINGEAAGDFRGSISRRKR